MRRISAVQRSLRACVLLAVVVSGACTRPTGPLPPAPVVTPTPAAPVCLPRDAGPHDALTEWWYYTGHLRTEPDAREYGFEFTIFQVRRAGAPAGYLAHFAISDVAGQRFSHAAHVSQSEPLGDFPLDVAGWRLASDGSGESIQAAMQAGAGVETPFSISLRVHDEKPPALHHGGYIDYGPAGGSYYYSRTRLAVSGTLRTGDEAALPVTGQAWMDHQWGNFVVAGGGWDWYSLQLDDRSELMLYVLRSSSGETTAVYGTQVSPDGVSGDLGPDAIGVVAAESWTSPHTGGVYPSGWRLSLPSGRTLILTPLLADQELYFPGSAGVAMAYWEGAVRVTGDVTGEGYVELTGYAR